MENNINREEMNYVSIEGIVQELVHEAARKAAREEEMQNTSDNRKYAILDSIKEVGKRCGVVIPQEALDKFEKLVMSVNASIAVTGRKTENPDVMECGGMRIEFKLEEADGTKTRKPYLLSIWFPDLERSGYAKSLKAMRLEKWLLGRGIPFVPELMQNLDEKKDVTVHVFRYIREFALEVAQLDFSDEDFVGQKVKNRMFDKDNAVGIVKDNVVNIYAPAWLFNKSTWTFYVH